MQLQHNILRYSLILSSTASVYIQNNIKQKYKQLTIVFLGGKKTQGPMKDQKLLQKSSCNSCEAFEYGILVWDSITLLYNCFIAHMPKQH